MRAPCCAISRWGFDLGEDITIGLMIVLTPLASALATYLKRNWRIDTSAGARKG